jgi:hypothetical protein
LEGSEDNDNCLSQSEHRSVTANLLALIYKQITRSVTVVITAFETKKRRTNCVERKCETEREGEREREREKWHDNDFIKMLNVIGLWLLEVHSLSSDPAVVSPVSGGNTLVKY